MNINEGVLRRDEIAEIIFELGNSAKATEIRAYAQDNEDEFTVLTTDTINHHLRILAGEKILKTADDIDPDDPQVTRDGEEHVDGQINPIKWRLTDTGKARLKETNRSRYDELKSEMDQLKDRHMALVDELEHRGVI